MQPREHWPGLVRVNPRLLTRELCPFLRTVSFGSSDHQASHGPRSVTSPSKVEVSSVLKVPRAPHPWVSINICHQKPHWGNPLLSGVEDSEHLPNSWHGGTEWLQKNLDWNRCLSTSPEKLVGVLVWNVLAQSQICLETSGKESWMPTCFVHTPYRSGPQRSCTRAWGGAGRLAIWGVGAWEGWGPARLPEGANCSITRW